MKHLCYPLIAVSMAYGSPTVAGIEVGGTRLIFDATKKEGSISVKNPEKETAYLVQSWLDNRDKTDTSKIPFVIIPPLFRLDAGEENQLRVINTDTVPQDRESLYWLSVKSIAATTKQPNRLQISVRTRIKMIYRPRSIKGAEDAYRRLTVSQVNGRVIFSNPTPFYISFFSVKVGNQNLHEPMMVAPFATYSLNVPKGASGKVSWRAINDYGARTEEVSR
ncbi:fimbrial biogenesis chaperone [Lelliottia wanjuensis]|uniref:Molecular chaperone n=1 Tax=Lelliottia wanjuensis TaxID=3050585 RepID=A0AAP4LCB2_9ENTR|nr:MULTISPECIES: molecular chaperone [unclassified Lelliottia]EDS5739622.1 molecular chaperone [Salmonella enterica subsp. enterica serovar Javiana]EEP0859196.1 molecular chaperone [Salmonella enterica]EGH8262077.1 molecular chaperone [Salmonella enterica]EGL2916314.1 molecular chaperone [Salmonella enterica]EJP9495753.1 molecular chaperone [Salmonella enterica]